MCKVSIIVPIYNVEKYLDQCLSSLQNQTLQDIEIILCDNASTDNSKDIIDKFIASDSRFKLVQQKTNVGQCKNMIAGLNAATGEYIAECDSDDWVDPVMYEYLYIYATRNCCDIMQCGWYDVIGTNSYPRSYCSNAIFFNFNEMSISEKETFLISQPHIMSCIYRRDWIINNNLWYRPNGAYEDTSLCFKHRVSANRYGILPNCLYYYRKDNPTSGSATEFNEKGILEQYKEIEKFNLEHNLHLEQYINIMKYYTYSWYLNRLPEKDRLKFKKKCAKEFKQYSLDQCCFGNIDNYYNYLNWRNME